MRLVQFRCLEEKFTTAYLHQIAREIILPTIDMKIDNRHDQKASQKVETDEILTARARYL